MICFAWIVRHALGHGMESKFLEKLRAWKKKVKHPFRVWTLHIV